MILKTGESSARKGKSCGTAPGFVCFRLKEQADGELVEESSTMQVPSVNK